MTGGRCGAERLRLIILDRDGVLNENRAGYVRGLADWAWIPGSREACARLRARGLRLGVVTNQAAIGHGLLTEDGLARIHDHLRAGLGRAADPLILHCPHLPEAGCDCRKPRPGMVLTMLGLLGVRPEEALLVGDHTSDLAAAAAAGCLSAHVRSGRGAPPDLPPPGYRGSFADLAAVAEAIAVPGGRWR